MFQKFLEWLNPQKPTRKLHYGSTAYILVEYAKEMGSPFRPEQQSIFDGKVAIVEYGRSKFGVTHYGSTYKREASQLVRDGIFKVERRKMLKGQALAFYSLIVQ